MTITYIRTPTGEFSCPNCGVTKRIQSTMHYHIRNCTGTSDNICTICNSNFYSKHGLDVHMKVRHHIGSAATVAGAATVAATTSPTTTTQLYTCPFDNCTYKPNTKGNCRVHCMRIHFGDITTKYINKLEHGDYSCRLCTSNFSSSTHYYYHIADCIEKYAETDILSMSDDKFAAFMTFSKSVITNA